MSDYQTPPGLQQQNEPKGGNSAKVATGCGIGCLVIFLVVGLVAFLAYRKIQSEIDNLANMAPSEPIEFVYPVVQANVAESVIRRFDAFRNALANSQPAEPLILTATEINTLISQHPDFEALAGRTMVKIDDNKISSAVSIKAEDLPFNIPIISKAFRDKYINGTATIDLSIKDGRAQMYLVDFKFGDFEIPQEFIDSIKHENLLKEAQSEEGFKKFIEQIKELKIEDNKLHIIPNNTPASLPTPAGVR